MAGIFLDNGSAPSATVNAQSFDATQYETGCEPLYYRQNCNPRLNVKSMNALISEVANAITGLGAVYDCSRLDNLSTALQTRVCQIFQQATDPTLDAGVTVYLCARWYKTDIGIWYTYVNDGNSDQWIEL